MKEIWGFVVVWGFWRLGALDTPYIICIALCIMKYLAERKEGRGGADVSCR